MLALAIAAPTASGQRLHIRKGKAPTIHHQDGRYRDGCYYPSLAPEPQAFHAVLRSEPSASTSRWNDAGTRCREPADGDSIFSGCRRRLLFGGALSVGSVFAPPFASRATAFAIGDSREARIEKMEAADAAKRRLCEGREGKDAGIFDMTFDPPCYISGYYELGAYALILGVLKIKTDMSPDESEEGRYYSLLDIKRDASRQEIKEAYRKQARIWHPDKWAGEVEEKQTTASEKFKGVREAYEVLSGTAGGLPQKRR